MPCENDNHMSVEILDQSEMLLNSLLLQIPRVLNIMPCNQLQQQSLHIIFAQNAFQFVQMKSVEANMEANFAVILPCFNLSVVLLNTAFCCQQENLHFS